MRRRTRRGTAAATAGMVAAVLASATLAGCGVAGDTPDRPLVGVAMPTTTSQRWIADGDNVTAQLEALGYEVDLRYAEDDVPTQVAQLEEMVAAGADALVIGSIDGVALKDVLAEARGAGIAVIAYDRLIRESPDIDYYATFDNARVGVLQATSLLQGLGVLDAGGQPTGEPGPFTVELFAGSPDDNNAKFFFSGAWDVLSEYVTKGQLVVPSGKAPASNDEWSSIGVQGWSSDTAQSEMETRLNSFYAADKVDVVLSPNDSLALGIAQALLGAGYTAGVDWPLITGQDADQANVENMLIDRQAMTVWKDTRTLGDQVAAMVDQVIKGSKVTVNDEETYDNGNKVVPTYLLPPVVVTKDSIKTSLVDSGFYSAADLGL